MNELALFAGAGGGILGGHLLGWQTVCAVEVEPYPASVLIARQNDELFPPFPIWDDVRSFTKRNNQVRRFIRALRKMPDLVVSGGFPCQDISSAGRGAGLDGERSGLWREMERIISEVRPRYAFVENSPVLTSRGLGTVLGDLAALGYDAEWCVLGADDVGAPHIRKRIWILAYLPDTTEFDVQAGDERIQRPPGSNIIGSNARTAMAYTSEQYGSKQGCKTFEPRWSGEDVADASEVGRGQAWTVNSIRHREHDTDLGGSRLAYTDGKRLEKQQSAVATESSYPPPQRRCVWWQSDPADLPDANLSDEHRRARALQMGREWSKEEDERAFAYGRSEWGVESRVGRVAHGVAARVDRLKSLGNGQVPSVAATAFRLLAGRAGIKL